ncbi:THUMP domain-containing class I SAM-dependent RNA methyltransferase [Planktothrix pseudagardhii]|uniref:RNA methyltransferase slr0064 n=1 Tax=Planktothrix pseudagardhii TaxID=132604 RepID=A0A9W4GAD4_9CYAN|nr:THUMP domain-containing protein [Planktothrix pseudagardhii]CAD5977673.1 Putative RNA methyltransferase slr0064 [Planktothrix pseudagardhii]
MTQYFATVAKGLEVIAAQELERLGAENVRPEFTGVHFTGSRKLLYRVNLWGRTLFRVLVPIAEFPCANAQQLYQEVQNINWTEYLSPLNTFAVNCTGKNEALNHTHFTALQVKNAIIDQQRLEFGERSDININNPDLWINLHLHENHGILSLDSSGTSLHRRGYRPAVGLAPLKESLASALLEMAEWHPNLPFLDPLCGSGTLPIEASLKALNIAPGLFRETFGFMKWKDFDAKLWQSLKHEALEAQLTILPAPIMGSDQDGDILNQAFENAQRCGVADQIRLQQLELSQIEPPADQGVIICNPPYGERLGEVEELAGLYKQLGDTFKQRFKGWTAYILTGNKTLGKQVGLRTSRRIAVYNGSLPCTLLKYELY